MTTHDQTSTLWELPPMPEQPQKKKTTINKKAIIIAAIAVITAAAVVLAVVALALSSRTTPTERVIRNYFNAIENHDADALFNLSAFGAIPYDDVAQPMREPFEQYMRDGALDMWGVVTGTRHHVEEPVFYAANQANLPPNLVASVEEFAAMSMVAEEFALMVVQYTIYATAGSYDGTGFFTLVRFGGNWHLMQDPYFFRGQ